MKKVKIKNKLILLIGIILLSGISLYGCGKMMEMKSLVKSLK